MSTNIDDAWRIPTNDLAELTSLGRQLREMQSASYVNDIISKTRFPWHKIAARELKKQDADFNKTARALRIPIIEVIGLQGQSPLWNLPDHLLMYLQNRVHEEMSRAELQLSDRGIDATVLLAQDVAEEVNRSSTKLVFLKGDAGSTYLKGFGITTAVREYLNKNFQSWEYTDQTEMAVTCFGKYVQERYSAAQNEQEKQKILRDAQHTRGEYWDAALGRFTKFSEVGLTFSLEDQAPTSSIYKIVAGLLQKAIDDDVSPVNKNR